MSGTSGPYPTAQTKLLTRVTDTTSAHGKSREQSKLFLNCGSISQVTQAKSGQRNSLQRCHMDRAWFIRMHMQMDQGSVTARKLLQRGTAHLTRLLERGGSRLARHFHAAGMVHRELSDLSMMAQNAHAKRHEVVLHSPCTLDSATAPPRAEGFLCDGHDPITMSHLRNHAPCRSCMGLAPREWIRERVLG
jgi:hypothetical protein